MNSPYSPPFFLHLLNNKLIPRLIQEVCAFVEGLGSGCAANVVTERSVFILFGFEIILSFVPLSPPYFFGNLSKKYDNK